MKKVNVETVLIDSVPVLVPKENTNSQKHIQSQRHEIPNTLSRLKSPKVALRRLKSSKVTLSLLKFPWVAIGYAMS